MRSKNILRKSTAVLILFITALLCSLFPSGVTAEVNTIVKGIVEENNTQLGYITLYNEDGTGTGKADSTSTDMLRTYNYLNPGRIEILKNHKKAAVDSIEAGDTAYIKLDGDGDILSISAVDNYCPKYGEIISKSSDEIAVQFDDGMQQILKVDNKVVVIMDKKLDSYSSLKDGDRVRLLLSITEKQTTLKEITIEGDEHFISNIYKGEALEIDDSASDLYVLNMQVLDGGNWKRTEQRGFTRILLAEDCKFYFEDTETDVEYAARLLSDNQAYIAVEKDYGGEDKAVIVSFRNEKDTEVLYNDSVANTASGSGSFSLDKEYVKVRYGAGSIIVKNSRLVTPGSLENKDKVMIVANRSYANGQFNAGVISINEQADIIKGSLYRARIKNINDNDDFTVESYSYLNGTEWVYCNTPKTFKITNSTRLLNDEGVADVRNFIGYGEDSYIGRTIYILGDDINALTISTAPYGVYFARGTVYGIKGSETGEEGTLLTEPDELLLRKVSAYDSTSCKWKEVKDMDTGLLKNSLIFKAGIIAKPSDIKSGDVVRIIKKEAGETGTAFVVIVE